MNKNLRRGAVALAALATSLVASTALAHTEMRESTPAAGSTVETLPAEVTALLSSTVTEGTLQVFDPCGAPVTTGDTELSQVSVRVGQPELPGSQLTVPVESSRTGNFQAIWTGLPLDGHAASGSWSFDVVKGTACAKVSRTDGNDNTNGIDLVSATTQKAPKGKVKISLTAAENIDTASLAKQIGDDAKGTVLDVLFETNQDGDIDLRGRIVPSGKKTVMLLGNNDLEKKRGTFAVQAKGKSVTVLVPAKALKLAKGKHLDVSFETRGNTEACGEAGCLDVAPDFGYLRALSG